MPGLEVHTLNQDTAQELPDLLVTRAGQIAAGGAALYAHEAPEISGAFSLYEDLPQEDVIYSPTGVKLDSVWSALERKERWGLFPVALGSLAAEATISTTSGCWSLVEGWRDYAGKEAWRDDKGYLYVWNPEHFGFKVDRNDKFKGVAIHRMAYNMKRRLQGLPDLNRYQHVDHICRWTGCCNIDHLNVLDAARNNQQRDLAKRLEIALMAGQTILGPMGIDWLDELVYSATSEFTNVLVTTPRGPHRIVVHENDPMIFSGQPEPCELVESVRAPAPTNYERRSRARPPRISEGQDIMFDLNDSLGKKIKKAKLYKDWQKTGRL